MQGCWVVRQAGDGEGGDGFCWACGKMGSWGCGSGGV